MPDEPSQLWMRLRPVEGVEPPALPDGFQLRTLCPGDEQAWIDLLNTGDFREWDAARLERMLTRSTPRLRPEGVFFIADRGRLAASACMFFLKEDGMPVGELGWVVAHPAWRGCGLGLEACRAALGHALEQTVESVFLRTEDSRLPAMRLYLRLGFKPEMKDDTHPARWEAVLATLGAR